MSSSLDSSTGGAADHSSGRADDTPGDDKHQAGAFDIRNFIGLLIGIYGVVLVVYGILDHDAAQTAKSDGININLWAGLGMAIVAAGFILWARVRPVVVPDEAALSAPDEPQP